MTFYNRQSSGPVYQWDYSSGRPRLRLGGFGSPYTVGQYHPQGHAGGILEAQVGPELRAGYPQGYAQGPSGVPQGQDNGEETVNQPYTGERLPGVLGEYEQRGHDYLNNAYATGQGFYPDGVRYGPVSTFVSGVRGEALSEEEQARINNAIDAVSGVPFGVASTLVNPTYYDTSWGEDFNAGGGGIIGTVANISRRNLERLHGQASAERGGSNPDFDERRGINLSDTSGPTRFYTPGQLPGANTAIATHENRFGGRVVSGNTGLLPPQADVNGDGTVSASEVDAWSDPSSPQRVEYDAIQTRRNDLNARQAAATTQPVTDQGEHVSPGAQDEVATTETRDLRRVPADERPVIGQTEDGEDIHANATGGSVVTDSSGNAVTSVDPATGARVAATSGGTTYSAEPDTSDNDSDDDGGDDDGGRWICSAMYHEGHWGDKEFKKMTKWSLKFSKDHDWWLGGYNAWGKVLAKHLVKDSAFWQSVVQANYDHLINNKLTAKAVLAKLVIYPGAFVLGKLGAKAPTNFRLATKKELGYAV